MLGNTKPAAKSGPAWLAAGMPCLIKEVLYAPPCPEPVALLFEVALTHHNNSAYDLAIKTYMQGQAKWESLLQDSQADAKMCTDAPTLPHSGQIYIRLAVASVFDSAGADEKALAELQEAQRLWNPHPATDPIQSTIDSMLGCVYVHISQFDLAADHFIRCLELREYTIGPQHVDTGLALNNIGVCLHCMNCTSDALVMYYKAEEIFKKAFRVEHPRTVTVARNIAKAKQSFLKGQRFTLPEGKAMEIKPSIVCKKKY